MNTPDPVTLTQQLIRYESITPHDKGAQRYVGDFLKQLGFHVQYKKFAEVDNLYARLGNGSPHICFLGHTDVVPAQKEQWQHPPFFGGGGR